MVKAHLMGTHQVGFSILVGGITKLIHLNK